jgi:hypothetical protein
VIYAQNAIDWVNVPLCNELFGVIYAQNAIDWVNVPLGDNSLVLQFAHPQEMLFALSVEFQSPSKDVVSSGMMWSRCVFDINAG